MAVMRERPYSNFNFLVNLGTGEVDSVQAGFSEVHLPDIKVDVLEYRTGNARELASRKLPGRVSYGDLVLRRGVIGALDLYEWLDQVRQSADARRTVVIELQNEERTEIVLRWRFTKAFPVGYEFSDLQGEGQSIVIETLRLTFEQMSLE